jgi:hypothetical protein
MPHYTKVELDEFGEWLKQFRTAKTVVDKKGVSHDIDPIDMQEAAVAFGAMSKKMQKVTDREVPVYSIILKMEGSREGGNTYERPTKYDLFNHKYAVWSAVNHAEKMKLEEYDNMAQEDKTV